jgi:17beta-estradiol 17-dehydrogenase / very-long-chain 3-oxoacyl-CoA reductase
MDAPPWFLVLMSIGGLYVTAAVLRHLLPHLMAYMRRPKDLPGVYGAWAVITGPTSGLGRSMALELARRGLNLVLVGRDPAKLQDVSDAIAAVHHGGVRTKSVVFDLSLASTAQGDRRHLSIVPACKS